MARGGSRAGKPGQAYGNRKDLNGPKIPIPKTPPSAQYGESAKLEAAQKAVPVGPPPGPPAPTAEVPQSRGPMPGAPGSMLRPTERPDEPLTAGIASGPGVGPTPSAPLLPGEDVLPRLQAYYQAFPSEALREMIEDIEMGNG